jgi:hypothetical protein
MQLHLFAVLFVNYNLVKYKIMIIILKIRFNFVFFFILYTIYFGTQNKKKLPITLLCYKYFFKLYLLQRINVIAFIHQIRKE